MILMRWFHWIATVLVWLLLASVAPSQSNTESEADAIPPFGWPAELPFSQASGNFRIATEASPTTVAVEDPLILVVRIKASGPVRHPPRRLILTELPAFRESFHIEDLPDASAELQAVVAMVGNSTPWSFVGGVRPQLVWEFRYRLKPKNLGVQEIPALPFVFYNRAILSPERRFQVLYADAIPIEVKLRETVETGVQGPAGAFDLVTGPALLDRVQPWEPPGPGLLAVILAAPPLVCWGWYLLWRRLNPSATRRALQRRSRAARLALDLLRRPPPGPGQPAQTAGTAVTRYLRWRLDLPFEEPTPGETAAYLVRRGYSLDVAGAAMQFYRDYAAVRFQPAPLADAADLPDQATRLILAMEAET